MNRGILYAISISPERGQLKTEVPSALLIKEYGIENDGHAGAWGRQVTCLNRASLLAINQEKGLNVGPGGFAENLLLEGLDFSQIRVGSNIRIGSAVLLEVTQIGKEDHPSIVTETLGVSLLPYEGLFCRVVSGGRINRNDPVEVIRCIKPESL